MEPEVVVSFNPKKWTFLYHNAASELDSPSVSKADPYPDGVPVCVRSSPGWEAVTTPETTFKWYP